MKYDNDRLELNSILMSEKPSVRKHRILEIVPELAICSRQTQKHPAHYLNVYEHILKAVDLVDDTLELRLVMLFHDIGKPYALLEKDGLEHFFGHEEKSVILARLVLIRLGYEPELINRVCHLIKYHDTKFEVSEKGIKDAMDLVGEDFFASLMKVKDADLYAHSEYHINRIAPILEEIRQLYHLKFEK